MIARHMIRLACALTVGLLLTVGAPASADTEAPGLRMGRVGMEIRYDLYWGGLGIGSIEGHGTLVDDRYALDLTISTRGIVALFVSGASRVLAAGRLQADGTVQAELFEVNGRWNDQDRRRRVEFGSDGGLAALTWEPDRSDEYEPVPADMQVSPDPVALFVEAATRLPEDWVQATFDGKRVVDIAVACAGSADLAPSSFAIYAGPTRICRVKGEQTAGFRREPWPYPVAFARPAELWLAPVARAGFHLPARVEIETNYGAVLIHLTHAAPLDTVPDGGAAPIR